jgi:uncharacterized protein YukE
VNDNPMIADVYDSTTWSTGLWLIEDGQALIDAIESGTWVDATIGGITVGLDALSTALDPLGALASMAIGWLMEHVEPLKDALDSLTGDADVVESYAATWDNVASGLGGGAYDLQTNAGEEIQAWQGDSSDAYREAIEYNIQGVGGMSAAAAALAAATRAAGTIVATVRGIVRDLIADCVATLLVRVPEWLAEEAFTLGLATPWVVSQVVSLVSKWVARITGFIQALITSLQTLKALIG